MTPLGVDLEGVEPRAARVLEAILRVVSGDFSARAEPSERSDSLDAVMVGLNMLAETLKREHAAKQKAETLLADAIDAYDNAPDFFCSCEVGSLRVVKCNEPLARALGKQVHEVQSLTLADLVQPGSRSALLAALERLATGQSPRGTELTLAIAEPLVVSVTGSVMRDASGAPVRFRLVLRDVSMERRLEDQLVHAQRMEAIGRLAGGVAHDFNNLLMVILSATDLLEAKLRAAPEHQKELRLLREAADRAALLTRDLLVFSRRETGRPRVMDADETLTRARSLLERLVGPNVGFELRCCAGGARVQFDPSRLEQVLMNLIVNARDALPDGGSVVVSTRELVAGDEYLQRHPDVAAGRYVELTVADTGAGIPEELRGRIFEPFFTTKPTGKGTGLGLSTVYGLVRQAGGYVTVESEQGKGTTFRVLLPALDGVPAPIPPLPVPAGLTQTILVVEDDDRVRAVTCRILREAGFRVLEAASSRAALSSFESEGPEIALVVSDVVMPEMSGPEVVAAMRQKRPDLRCVFVTGFAHDREEALARAGGAVLPKPFLPAALLACVREELTR